MIIQDVVFFHEMQNQQGDLCVILPGLKDVICLNKISVQVLTSSWAGRAGVTVASFV